MDRFKFLGTLNETIATYWQLDRHKNKPILVFDDRIEHVKNRHLSEFGSEEKVMDSYNKLNSIIKKPDFTFYNSKNNSIEFYKKYKGGLCVAVRVSPGKYLKVRSWFPVKNTKYNNRKKSSEEHFYLTDKE